MFIPNTAGVSDLQRKGKEVLEPIKNNEEDVVLLSDRSHVFGAIVNIEHYKELLKLATQQENDFWLSVTEKTFDFWDHPSNDAYEKCI